MHALSCQRCGASLPAAEGSARCTYCGTVHQGAPRPGPEPRPRSRGGRPSAIVLSLAALAAAGLGVGAYAIDPPPAGPSEVYGLGGPCVLEDRTGDGVADLGVLLFRDFEVLVPALVDGATGEVRWRGRSYPRDSSAFCASPRHLALEPGGAMALELVEVGGEGPPQRLALSNRPTFYGTGRGCFTVRSADGVERRFRVGEGGAVPGACPAAPRYNGNHVPGGRRDVVEGPTEGGTARYRLELGEPGSPLVTALREGGFRRELREALPPAGRVGLVAVPDGVVVLASAERSDETGYVVALDAEDGRVRWRTTIHRRYGVGFHRAVTNGPAVIAGFGHGLYAFRVSDGQRLWSLGP